MPQAAPFVAVGDPEPEVEVQDDPITADVTSVLNDLTVDQQRKLLSRVAEPLALPYNTVEKFRLRYLPQGVSSSSPQPWARLPPS